MVDYLIVKRTEDGNQPPGYEPEKFQGSTDLIKAIHEFEDQKGFDTAQNYALVPVSHQQAN